MMNVDEFSPYDVSNYAFVEALYEQYLSDGSSVSDTWVAYFKRLENGEGLGHGYVSHRAVQEELRELARRGAGGVSEARESGTSVDVELLSKNVSVQKLIHSYRLLGHMRASLDPLGLAMRPSVPDLDYGFHGLTDADLPKRFSTTTLSGPDTMPLFEVVDMLKRTYAGSLGVEFQHITNLDQKRWLQQQLESRQGRPNYALDKKHHILRMLSAAEGLERFLHTRYSGQKRFSLEGGESLIPLLDELVQRGGTQGVREVVLGMAHRGRLNVLINIMGKQPGDLMSEFEGLADMPYDKMTGDVKYHKGYSSDVRTPGGPVHLALAFNPSHLEIISPVVQGSSRARQDRLGGDDRRGVLPIFIHGDAALAGQGVVYETAQLSETRGYHTGGSIHVVVNNQVGFTTSHLRDARSSLYCTDVGKVIQAPIFHVNADDPEAVVFAAQLAIDFRMMWHRDVFIDLVCYRRHGHNEGDEPMATQPEMYSVIRSKQTTRELYAARLVGAQDMDEEEVDALVAEYRQDLTEGQPVSYSFLPHGNYSYLANWIPFLNGHWTDDAFTGVPEDELQELGLAATHRPKGFTLHRSVKKIMDDRKLMVQGEVPLDWGCAETLAYATLLNDGFPVRFSGQDSCRGTFFHRHAKVHDVVTGGDHVPLANLFRGQPSFEIYDSILSEVAVLGFEYGYSTTNPNTLTVWEAQYGDFVNGAQVVIDQFISSSEQKWHLFSGLVMMLPHGWEGQGPEHSSARLERFLQLCAQENMQICVPSTAAQMFHLLRRQMIRKLRIPLIIMSPKSMLRRKVSFSSLADLSEGAFLPIIGEVEEVDPKKVDRVVLCSGKVYYVLAERRRELGLEGVAIIRLEQLYPWPYDLFEEMLEGFPCARTLVWTQEEPRNQGAWYQLQHRIRRCLREGQSLVFAGRVPCSAPAGGSMTRHNEREGRLIDEALGCNESLEVIKTMSKPAKKAGRKAPSK